ncbi:hypothetical protein [Fundidesulfovibrio terrae]|uniref:hypothetical protein n=1 Tax=Fundidesulfovibrio terrae TaxID=2922866 RepID=UPI001FAF71D3|nr:hypothetical protein [Fundidesulfovibrio terrae]
MNIRTAMKVLSILLCCFAVTALLAPQAALSQDKAPPKPAAKADSPSGKVSLTLGQAGFLIGASGGKGTLTFRGKTYAFELGGIGIGEFGGSKAVCEGEVYNLTRIEDFPGAYVQLKSGYTGTEGKGEIWLKNSNGVELELRSRTKGLELTAEAEGVMIKFKEAKKK